MHICLSTLQFLRLFCSILLNNTHIALDRRLFFSSSRVEDPNTKLGYAIIFSFKKSDRQKIHNPSDVMISLMSLCFIKKVKDRKRNERHKFVQPMNISHLKDTNNEVPLKGYTVSGKHENTYGLNSSITGVKIYAYEKHFQHVKTIDLKKNIND